LKTTIPPKIAAETNERAAVIQQQFLSIASDLSGINAWRYQRQISGGVQEYLEAISFEHYLRHQNLISIKESAALLPATIDLTGDDYVLGFGRRVDEVCNYHNGHQWISARIKGR
jgi:predicted translin family RNA/ssDNA-binding protein